MSGAGAMPPGKAEFFIERLAVIGVGLIGGSVALALRQAGVVGEITGFGRSRENLETARNLGIIDRFSAAYADLTDADMVLVATPISAMARVFRNLAGVLSPQTVITDAGSVKNEVIRIAQGELGAAMSRFVPGHPIAGTEYSGAGAAFAQLYRQRRVILTPLPETDTRAVAQIRRMWQSTGAEVENMKPDEHDRVLAATSHLPHAMAYCLVDYLASQPDRERYFSLAAGGFYDFTRIASSNPAMWRDILLANATAVSGRIRDLSKRLEQIAAAIEAGDGDALLAVFTHAQQTRDRVGRLRRRRDVPSLPND